MPMIGDRPELNLKTVVYATDFSLCSQNAGLYAARIASYFSATLLVTHAFTLSQAALEVEIDKVQLSQQRKDLNSLLSQNASLLGAESIEAIATLLEGDPKDVIPALADRSESSLRPAPTQMQSPRRTHRRRPKWPRESFRFRESPSLR